MKNNTTEAPTNLEVCKVLEDCMHTLTTFHGLIATDKPGSGVTFEIDTDKEIKAIEALLKRLY